ncbi:hypothetical protein BD779DRAFT_1489069 [Infundibulicybe gibba]|nr:hypothetical protein BD779DRAFT_1489069 [Infundibulicybe gibba]
MAFSTPCCGGEHCIPLVVYDQNKIARALQIPSSGNNALASPFTLYNGHGLKEQAGKLGLAFRDTEDDGGKVIVPAPHPLASRLIHLNSLVKQRKRWWTSLVHNTAQQKNEQPFILIVTILEILFGACTIIQTVFPECLIYFIYRTHFHHSIYLQLFEIKPSI